MKITKITTMENTISKTLIVNSDLVDVVRNLLASGWRKEKARKFFKDRNNYRIEMDGVNNPIWEVLVKPKTEAFDENDWKLLQDLKGLNNLGKSKSGRQKKLYVNDNNRDELSTLVGVMENNGFNVVFNNDYIIFKLGNKKVKVFKIAAQASLTEQKDGWYIGEKRII